MVLKTSQGFQAFVDKGPKVLLKKDLHMDYSLYALEFLQLLEVDEKD